MFRIFLCSLLFRYHQLKGFIRVFDNYTDIGSQTFVNVFARHDDRSRKQEVFPLSLEAMNLASISNVK